MTPCMCLFPRALAKRSVGMGCSPSIQAVSAYKNATKANTTGGVSKTFISDSERRMVRKTWKIVSNNMPVIGARIFLEIFSRAPPIKQIFPFRDVTGQALLDDPHFKGHASRFMQAVGAAVDNLGDLEQSMAPLLFGLGQQHIHFTGFDVTYFDVFIPAIMAVWEGELGTRFNEDTRLVWKRLFGFMILKLKEGYNDAISKKEEELVSDTPK